MSKIGIAIKIFRQGQFNQLNILGKFPVNEKRADMALSNFRNGKMN
jgi:hypothetical protein